MLDSNVVSQLLVIMAASDSATRERSGNIKMFMELITILVSSVREANPRIMNVTVFIIIGALKCVSQACTRQAILGVVCDFSFLSRAVATHILGSYFIVWNLHNHVIVSCYISQCSSGVTYFFT